MTDIMDIFESTELRAPIGCIMGHVDAGKTSLLDAIRNTTIANKEAGGITQQIGATFLPKQFILNKTNSINGKFSTKNLNIPGLLMIDTPGHEAFFKLRQRGTSMCDIAILAIDITDGILPQTKEAIELLLKNKVPFVIAATKLDKVWGWKSIKDINLRNSYKKQDKSTQETFMGYIDSLKHSLLEEGIKSEFYFNNKDPTKLYSIVPVSSLYNEGIQDLLSLVSYLTTNWMNKKLITKEKLKASIMEVFYDKKLGWTMDVIIINGKLQIGDSIIIPKTTGCEETKIKNLLLPSQDFINEIDKNKKWISNEYVNGACGVRIIASNLENTLAGGHIYKISDFTSIELAIQKANKESDELLESLPTSENGIILMAETLGALEAASFLFNQEELPIKKYMIGKLNDKLIDKLKLILEKEEKVNKTVLYFGNIFDKDLDNIKKQFKNYGIQFIQNSVIYQLIENYKEYKLHTNKNINDILIKEGKAILPIKLQMLKDYLFVKGGNKHFLLGVKILFGELKKNTPIAVVKDGNVLHLGVIESIQKDSKEKDCAKIHEEVCIKISNPNNLTLGRQFDEKWDMYSHQTRESIENLKKYFREELKKEDWKMIIEQKNILSIK